MIILYNIIFILGFIIMSPVFLYKLIRYDKWREGLKMRLGFYPPSLRQKLAQKKTILIHASSVGEVKAVLPVVKSLRERFGDYHIVLTTVTRTGNHVARTSLEEGVSVLYFPLDFSLTVSRALRLIHPKLVILVESELWANFLSQLYRKNIPVALINVRMSMRSFMRFKKAVFFVKPFLNKLSLITAPTSKELAKMTHLGASPEHIKVVGNLKYERDEEKEPTEVEKKEMASQLGIPQNAFVFLCGSTHPGEEEVLVGLFQELLKEYSNLFLILAPRHPERAMQVSSIVENRRLSFRLRTEEKSSRSHQVLILNTVGELERIYSIADVVFIGKSLIKKGGQNFLEPARFGKAIVFGPHMENFEDMAGAFVDGGGALQIQDVSSLKEALNRLIRDPKERMRLGRAAMDILASNHGAVEKTVDLLAPFLKD